MSSINWEYLKGNFSEIINDINPYNYDAKELIYAKTEQELKEAGLSYLENLSKEDYEDDCLDYIEFEFMGEGYYAYSKMENSFIRIDEIIKNEINSAIFAKSEFPDSFWGEFQITDLMYRVLEHIKG